MKPEVQSNKIVVISGSGISAESGLPTFRDSGGLWNSFTWQEVSSPEGWKNRPESVLNFYNERRLKASQATPNFAHQALAALESAYEVVILTQNVDDLHERAGSKNVIHLHGELAYAKSTGPDPKRYRINSEPITLGQLGEDGTQLRPDIVWFGEEVQHLATARLHVASAAKVLVIGTSLTVYPAASLVKAARGRSEKILNALDFERVPFGFKLMRGKATDVVPALVQAWLSSK